LEGLADGAGGKPKGLFVISDIDAVEGGNSGRLEKAKVQRVDCDFG
jgi:hypothetical protein